MLGEPCGTPCLVPGHTPTSTNHVSLDKGIAKFPNKSGIIGAHKYRLFKGVNST